MKKYEITEETLAKTLNYLATRPFLDVHQLIAELQQVRPITENKKEEKEDKDKKDK